MGALDAVEWEPSLLEPLHDREVERQLRRSGMVPPAVAYFLDVPWLVRGLVALNMARIPLVHISVELNELIALVVSQDNACRYCYAITRSVLRIMGFPEERVRRLEEDLLTAELPEADRLALDLARRVSRASPLPSAADALPLRSAGFSDDAIIEIVSQTTLNIFMNRVATSPALPFGPMEEISRQWWVTILRPLIARFVRPPRGSAVALSAEQRRGPFAELVNTLDGLPLAPRFRAVLDDAWASSILSRRAKGLVFAVVARGLGCPVSEAEALRLLVAEGVAEREAREVLAHLGGPWLDAIERIAVPFARETIWYQPAALQRRARALRAQLSRPQFVELIGTTALANAICRMSLALDLPRGPG